MALDRYPTLNAILGELTTLSVRSHADQRRARGSGGSGGEIRTQEGRDTTSVYIPWLGEFILAGAQREVVRQLLHAHIHCKTPDVEERTLAARAGVRGEKMSSLFAGNRAWGTLVIQGDTPTTYRIAPPPELEDDEEEVHVDRD